MSSDLGEVARNAAKWSVMSEVIAKIAIPLTQLILARILAPEAFGIIATVVMVTSFAEMISEAGFQKYLIQHQFRDEKNLNETANVAFWSSFCIAVTIFVIVVLYREELAIMVGNPGLGLPIAVASLSIPISVFVSTQQALFRRKFEYKKLLPIRVTVALIPLIVSVPLALFGLGYWALITGTLLAGLTNAIAMTSIAQWKPRLFYSFSLLKEMVSFSCWSLLEAISIWMTLWAGTFVVGNLLSPYELGLYRQPILVVNSAFALITSATTPILFTALSRLQSEKSMFRQFFFRFQFSVAVVLFPVGVGAYFYRDFFTAVLFGPQWSEASLMFGAWALTTSLSIVFSHYCSEIFRSLGKPRISFLSQCMYMAIMIPALYFAALDGFVTLVVVNALVRIVAIFISQLLTFFVAGIGFWQVIKNLYAPILASTGMGVVAAWTSTLAGAHWGWSVLGIVGCAIVYGSICFFFRSTRSLILEATASFRNRRN